jgi:aminoglycoside 6'-N-acetyltransferase I
VKIRRVEPDDWSEWLRMRVALWPDCPVEKQAQEMTELASLSPRTGGEERVATEVVFKTAEGQGKGPPVFVAERAAGQLGGFIELSLRKYADGCNTSPVGYIEGWYVDPEMRRQGVGAALVRAGEAWARLQGCTEMASDCLLDNEISFRAHLAVGYEEAERLIHFCKRLSR